jgi:hypothetical protein
MTPDADLLSALRERVASLQVLPCRLAHERVLIENGLAKRRIQGAGMEQELVRVGLCPSAIRSRQLSCAHTRAHDVFEQAIRTAAQANLLHPEEAGQMRSAVRRIALAIYMTDSRKNQAEVRHALLLERQAADEAAPVREELEELIRQHGVLAAELAVIRERLLERLDAATAS